MTEKKGEKKIHPARLEKRKFSRTEGLTFPIEYTLKEKNGPFRQARAMSIGEAGFLIGARDRLSIGAALKVKLYLPKTLFPFSDWQSVMTEARVVRADQAPDSESEFHYGIFITDISAKDAVCLKNYLASSAWRTTSGNR